MMKNYKVNQEMQDRIFELKKENLSNYKIAKEVGLSHTTVYAILKGEKVYQPRSGILLSIIKKMIPPFVENEIKVDFEKKERELMKEIMEEM